MSSGCHAAMASKTPNQFSTRGRMAGGGQFWRRWASGGYPRRNDDGKQPPIWLGTGREQVVAVVGKRGSGKSFTLGVLAEGLASGPDSPIARQANPRAVLLFDPYCNLGDNPISGC